MFFLLVFLLLTTFFYDIRGTASCEENLEIDNVRTNPYYDEWGHYQDRKNITRNATITCSKVYTISQIPFLYEEKEYEQVLVIVDSNISSIHPSEFDRFHSIIKLHLSGLYIKSILPGAFSKLSRLKELYLDNNELTEISNGVYNSLHRLEIFNVSYNKIHIIENVAIVGLTSLTHFYASNNNIKKIDNNFFETLRHLIFLDLSNNNLEKFPFNEVSTIESLLLGGSEIKALDYDLSQYTMKVFDFSNSKLSTIDCGLLPKANEINLSGNNISKIENIQDLDTLTVNFGNNQLDFINGVFGSISKCNLGGNKITSFEKSVFSEPSLILELDLSYNNLSNFSEDFFHNFTSLTLLKLQHNNLKQLQPVWFKNLPMLKVLDLSGNNIEYFEFGTFDNLINLQVFNISSNHLKDLNQYTFSFLGSLQELYFDNNQISFFDAKDLIRHLPNLRIISLDHNFWKCKELVSIGKYFENFKIHILSGSVYNKANFHGIACLNSQESISNTSTFSAQEISKNIQQAVNNGFRNSRMEQFFNQDFKESKFSKYFDEDYVKSGFFKYFSNFKFMVEQENLNGTQVEKLTSIQSLDDSKNRKILIFSVIIQTIMTVILLSVVFFLFTLFKHFKFQAGRGSVSQIELC